MRNRISFADQQVNQGWGGEEQDGDKNQDDQGRKIPETLQVSGQTGHAYAYDDFKNSLVVGT